MFNVVASIIRLFNMWEFGVTGNETGSKFSQSLVWMFLLEFTEFELFSLVFILGGRLCICWTVFSLVSNFSSVVFFLLIADISSLFILWADVFFSNIVLRSSKERPLVSVQMLMMLLALLRYFKARGSTSFLIWRNKGLFIFTSVLAVFQGKNLGSLPVTYTKHTKPPYSECQWVVNPCLFSWLADIITRSLNI